LDAIAELDLLPHVDVHFKKENIVSPTRKSMYIFPFASLLVAMAVGCSSSDLAGPEASGEAVLLEVVPNGGQVGVDPSGPMFAHFDHPMGEDMHNFASLHEGDLDGPEVHGAWGWSHEHRRLNFVPHEPLHEHAEYTLHLGGGLIDQHGHHVDFEQHGFEIGGQWVHGGMMGPGHGHEGPGWRHQNGSYGMFFRFMTGD
jgi:hypothetical protein